MFNKIFSKLIKIASWPGEYFKLGERMGGMDKFLHFEVSLVLSMVLCVIFNGFPVWPIIITMIIGVIKEIIDVFKPNPTGFSWLDLFWDCYGCFAGSFIVAVLFALF